MGFGSFFKKAIRTVTSPVSNILGGGGAGSSATATAKSNINFKPTTNVNFDTTALKNAYLDGSQTLANAFTSNTDREITLMKDISKKELEQNKNFFTQELEQNEYLNNELIKNKNINTTKELVQNDQISKASLKMSFMQMEQLEQITKSNQKQIAILVGIGIGTWLYIEHKKKGKNK